MIEKVTGVTDDFTAPDELLDSEVVPVLVGSAVVVVVIVTVGRCDMLL